MSLCITITELLNMDDGFDFKYRNRSIRFSYGQAPLYQFTGKREYNYPIMYCINNTVQLGLKRDNELVCHTNLSHILWY